MCELCWAESSKIKNSPALPGVLLIIGRCWCRQALPSIACNSVCVSMCLQDVKLSMWGAGTVDRWSSASLLWLGLTAQVHSAFQVNAGRRFIVACYSVLGCYCKLFFRGSVWIGRACLIPVHLNVFLSLYIYIKKISDITVMVLWWIFPVWSLSLWSCFLCHHNVCAMSIQVI